MDISGVSGGSQVMDAKQLKACPSKGIVTVTSEQVPVQGLWIRVVLRCSRTLAGHCMLCFGWGYVMRGSDITTPSHMLQPQLVCSTLTTQAIVMACTQPSQPCSAKGGGSPSTVAHFGQWGVGEVCYPRAGSVLFDPSELWTQPVLFSRSHSLACTGCLT